MSIQQTFIHAYIKPTHHIDNKQIRDTMYKSAIACTNIMRVKVYVCKNDELPFKLKKLYWKVTVCVFWKQTNGLDTAVRIWRFGWDASWRSCWICHILNLKMTFGIISLRLCMVLCGQAQIPLENEKNDFARFPHLRPKGIQHNARHFLAY